MSSDTGENRGVAGLIAAAGVTIALAVIWILGLPRSPSLGWDEAMHAELPAARMVVAVQAGEPRAAFDALHSCAQYPFVHPLFLAAVQAVFGVGERIGRAAGTILWCAAILGLFLLGREVSAGESAERRSLVGWIALALGALSPMCLAFAGTLFFEVPSACAIAFALHAWMRRAAEPRAARDVAAGAWVAVCVFTKFNYGCLLALGLGLDWICEGIDAARSRRLAAFAAGSGRILLVPAVVCLWWFALPVPARLDVGLEHRRAFLEYLAGNRDFGTTPYALRLLHASTWLTLTPRLLALVVLAAIATLPLVRRRGVRVLWFVFLSLGVPILAHPFHLDRFLIPLSVPLWPLAALGISRLLPARLPLRAALLGGLALLALSFPDRARLKMAARLGYLSEEPATRAYQEGIYRAWSDLSGSRPLPTGGLERGAADRFLDAVARTAGPDGRVGWIGVSSELSPAAIHLGLLARGGSRERFLRDSAAPMDVAYFGEDPAWSDADLARFASAFDVVFFTNPPDLKGRSSRAWTTGYRRKLVVMGYDVREIDHIAVSKPLVGPQTVVLLTCRRKP